MKMNKNNRGQSRSIQIGFCFTLLDLFLIFIVIALYQQQHIDFKILDHLCWHAKATLLYVANQLRNKLFVGAESVLPGHMGMMGIDELQRGSEKI